ncbi:Sec-independent protein secretion pathway component TatC [Halorhabdus sp. BNX81]|nr:Sec-independent protein secretion pathway component TatC [Halorhabdus sp. BNX81]
MNKLITASSLVPRTKMSGAIDDGTRRTLASGRETLGAMLRSAQQDIQKVFIAFVFGLVGTIWILQTYVWDRLKADLFAGMTDEVREGTNVVVVSPFDVILLQVKIGLIVGALFSVPLFLYFSRDALRRRGWLPQAPIARWKLVLLVMATLVLFVGGVAYSYTVFFPIMFSFLASNAIKAGFVPTYHIVKWVEFIFLLALSFGIAAQLPLVMSTLAYAEIVPYETFRDRWKHAVLGLYAAGAMFTPPEPLTQLMWATPLVALYAVSLRITKLVVGAKRSRGQVNVTATLRERWNVLAGAAIASFAVVYGFFAAGGVSVINEGLAIAPGNLGPVPTIGTALGLPESYAAALVAATLAVPVVAWVGYRSVAKQVQQEAGIAMATMGDPTEIDLTNLDRAGIEAAPPEAFEALEEHEALSYINQALENGNNEKAELILERFDEANERAQQEENADEADEESSDDSGIVSGTATGVVDAFTEDETTEDDIGGYYYDLRFILESLTSKMFVLVAVFMAVFIAAFGALYMGGINYIRKDFLRRLPADMIAQGDIAVLHPVEHLVFELKVSTLLGVVAILPLVCYYVWPALKDREWVTGDRRTLLVWGGSLVVGIGLGSYIGYSFIAPRVMSWLAADAIDAHMVVKYRVNTFGWLLVFTTVGIGLLAEIPVTMLLFHRGGLVSYQTMAARWRVVVLALFALAMVVTPGGMFSLLLVAIPASLSYLLGLGILWLYTFGGRRKGPLTPATT